VGRVEAREDRYSRVPERARRVKNKHWLAVASQNVVIRRMRRKKREINEVVAGAPRGRQAVVAPIWEGAGLLDFFHLMITQNKELN
jgi:hypothetical protein